MTGLALLAMALYATLVPWHAASRALQRVAAASLDLELAAAFCHAAPGEARSELPPSMPDGLGECPVCKGFGSLQFALAPATLEWDVIRHGAAWAGVAHPVGIASRQLELPRSRGPPAHA